MNAPKPVAETYIEPTAKLLLRQAIGQAYSGWFRRFPDVMRATWFWIILLVMAMGAADWLKWSVSVSAVESFKAGVLEDPMLRIVASGALYVLTAVMFIVATIDIAVTWHRRLILGEAPAPIGSNVVKNAFWSYFSRLLVLVAAVGGPIVIFLIVIELDHSSDESYPVELGFDELLAASVALVILLAALAIFSRMSLVLPSSATREVSLTFKQSWKLTRDNTWRLMLGLIVCAFLPLVPIDILSSLFGLIDPKISYGEMLVSEAVPIELIDGALGHQIRMICQLLILPIGVGFLSHCYQQLTRLR